jgi:hypothetical protein
MQTAPMAMRTGSLTVDPSRPKPQGLARYGAVGRAFGRVSYHVPDPSSGAGGTAWVSTRISNMNER